MAAGAGACDRALRGGEAMSRFAERLCEHCEAAYSPRSRTQRFCEQCRVATLTCSVCTEAFTVPRVELAKRPCCFCSKACKARASGGVYMNQGRWWVVCRDGTKIAYARAVVAG